MICPTPSKAVWIAALEVARDRTDANVSALSRELHHVFPERSLEACRVALRRARAGTLPSVRQPRPKATYQQQRRKFTLRHKYGITPETYDGLVATQQGRCPICLVSLTASAPVDHCHATAEIRGVLCRKCNMGLGLFGDDAVRLARAIVYLAPPQAR